MIPLHYLFHRESASLEYKENFSLSGLAEYFKDFAAFANNKGGYLVFGAEDSPRRPNGIDGDSLKSFSDIDQQIISGHLNAIFSPSPEWEQREIKIHGKTFGVFYIYEAKKKPVVAKKDEGKAQNIKNGEIYFRYNGRTQKIEYAELESIIESRVMAVNENWMRLMSRIGKVGPSNAVVLDTENGVIENSTGNTLIIDENLIDKIKFIREGEFSEKHGATTLKLIGEVESVNQVEVTKVIRKNITDLYPYSYKQMMELIKSNIDSVRQHEINDVIKSNKLKDDIRYCAYNFRNKQQDERYKRDGYIPATTPTIYNDDAVEFIIGQLNI